MHSLPSRVQGPTEMASTTILRRSVTSMAPLAVRAVHSSVAPLALRAVQGNHPHSALFSSVHHWSFSPKSSSRPFPSMLHFYSSFANELSTDDDLLRVIDSEIKYAEEADDRYKHGEYPDGFPFEIQDDLGEERISLSRKYQGETIKVIVQRTDPLIEEDDDYVEEEEGEGEGEGEGEEVEGSLLYLIVDVSKKHGPSLEFCCTSVPDEITIYSLTVKNPEDSGEETAYEGPDFFDLDENLQKAFHEYLETRGIKPAMINFFHDYMTKKENREYTVWLKTVKKFLVD